MLEQQSQAVARFVKLFAAKKLASQLASLGVNETDSPLMLALQNEKLLRKRNVKIGILSFGVLIAFICVWSPYMNNSLQGSAAAAMFLIAVGTAATGSAWAHSIYLKQKLQVEPD